MPEYEQTYQWFRKSSIGMTYAFCTILVMLVRIFSFVTKTKFRPNMKTSTLGALLNHKVCISSRGNYVGTQGQPCLREAKSATYNVLNQNWLSVGCECVLYIFSLYVSKLSLNMFSLWQIYYSKYTFYMQIEACDLQIFVGVRGAKFAPLTPQSGLRPDPTRRLPPPGPPAPFWSHQMLASLPLVRTLANFLSYRTFMMVVVYSWLLLFFGEFM